MAVAGLIEEYLAGPALLRNAVAGMSREELLARPIADKWTTLELACHLADFEPIFAARMKQIIAQENPTLAGGDQKLFMQHLCYHQRELEEELAVIETTRQQMGRILHQLPEDAFDRQGIHTVKGPQTLEDNLRTIVGHIPHHVPFIAEKRAALAD